jgi:hypothetical protein
MPTTGSKRSPESIAKFKATMAKKHVHKKKRKYVRRANVLPEPDNISVSGAIILLRKAKKTMTMDDLAEKDLYVLLALQELQGSI